MELKSETKLSLREIQNWMKWIIVDPRGVKAALNDPFPKNPSHPERYFSPTPSALILINSDTGFQASERLSIYAEAYFSRIVDSLGSDFQAAKRILGEDLFLKLIADYLKEFPSRTTNIGEIGKNLPLFIETYSLADDLPYLRDMVFLEWNIIESFYALDSSPLNVAKLSGISENQWIDAKIEFDKSVKILKTKWPIQDLWSNRENECFEKTESSLVMGENYILLHRVGGAVQVKSISEITFQVLEALVEGATLGEVLIKVEGAIDGTQMMDLFGSWTRNGIIKNFNFKIED